MKIGLQTWGSNGDIRPFIALASGLKNKGHEVILIVSSLDNRSYLETCRTLGIDYLQIPEIIDFDMQDFAKRTFKMNTLQWLIELLNQSLFPYESEIYQASKQLAQICDVLIGHHFLYPLKIAALKSNKPYITVTFCHAAIPHKTHAPFRFPNLGFLNGLQWRILNELFDWILKKPLSRIWFQENLPPFKHVFETMLTSDCLNLVAVDEFLCQARDGWSPVNQLCGFLNLPDYAEDWQPSEALQQFLLAGEKPVYMTFGSIQQAVPEWSMDLFIEAARLVGCRAIIQTSSEKYPAETQLENCFFIGRHPHQPLFKQCAAVVHHGGAGTTHASTLSGCASVVIPFMDEQLFWACQLEKAGVAPKPLPARKANAQALAERIKTVLQTPSMTEKAQLAKQAISPTQGVLNAVAMIENLLVMKSNA